MVIVRSRLQTFHPGELPLVLLALVETGPAKAYELLDELDRLFGPSYRASPGGVYPALTALVEERLLVAHRDGRAKRYALTAAGRRALDSRRRQLAALEERTGVHVTAADSLLPHVERFAARVMQRSGKVDTDLVVKILDDAASEIESLEESSGATD